MMREYGIVNNSMTILCADDLQNVCQQGTLHLHELSTHRAAGTCQGGRNPVKEHRSDDDCQ